MSWPSDGEPRFVVVETRGILDMPMISSARNDSRHRVVHHATYAVLDRAVCHRDMRLYRSESYWRIGMAATTACASARHDAETYAEELNTTLAVAA